MGAIGLRGVTKDFGGGVNAVDEVTLDIADGEFLVLVGPSGCGKSTLLRMIAGIEPVSAGNIVIDGNDATYALPKERDIAMVFQSYALYPHMTVLENLEFGLKLRKVPKADRRARATEVMKMLRLEALGKRKPGQLSGGQRQRVAMGRAMVREPTAFLMDEPLSNLDAKLRVAMRAELARLHDRVGVTTIYVTHDQIEAMTLGDRVAVLKDGVLQQVDTPQCLYHDPSNVFVAAFIGSPTINLVEAAVADGGLSFGGHSLPVPHDFELGTRGRVVLGIRPADFALAEGADPGLPRITVTVEVVENLGAEMHVVFPVDAPRVDVEGAQGDTAGEDDRLLADARSLFTAAIPARRPIEVGEEIELAVDIGRAQLFDSQSGNALDFRRSRSLPSLSERSGSIA
jgi:multiple sugar transport system ATP-binding protein